MSNKRKIIIGVVCFLVVVAIGLVLFFSLSKKKTEIYVNSYDNQVKFSLGSYSVSSFSVSSRTGNSITKTPDVDEILQDKIVSSPYVVSTFNTELADAVYTNYVLLYDGYYFVAWVDSSGQLVLENLVGQFSAATTEFLFSFPVTDMSFEESEDNFVHWEDLIWINDFAGLANFYSAVAEGYCEIDEAAQTIKLNCCDANNFREVTTNFPITITCSDGGLSLSFDSTILNYD